MRRATFLRATAAAAFGAAGLAGAGRADGQLLTWALGEDGYVYLYSTGYGRSGPLLLHRVPAEAIADPAAYASWGHRGPHHGLPARPGDQATRRPGDQVTGHPAGTRFGGRHPVWASVGLFLEGGQGRRRRRRGPVHRRGGVPEGGVVEVEAE